MHMPMRGSTLRHHKSTTCYKVWVKEIRSVCIADTVFLKHKYITMPTVSKEDTIIVATMLLAQVIKDEIEPNIGEKRIDQLQNW